MFSVALFAIDRSPFSGLKRYGGFCTTVSTCYSIRLSWLIVATPAVFPPGGSALRAATGFILQPVRFIELLLTGGENELLPAITAYQGLVCQSHYYASAIFC